MWPAGGRTSRYRSGRATSLRCVGYCLRVDSPLLRTIVTDRAGMIPFAAQFNDEFCSCEAIVALEVIEHLEQHVLDKFAPMILGEYRPRLLLVTTPSAYRFGPTDWHSAE
jgi:hypothetical protein